MKQYSQSIINSAIERFIDKNESIRQISREMKISFSTVHRWINTTSLKKKQKPGRKNILKGGIRLKIRNFVEKKTKQNLKVSVKNIKNELGLAVSDRTIRRALHSMGISHGAVKKRIDLTDRHKQNRVSAVYGWARDQIKWQDVIFTDEKRFSLDGPDNQYTWTINKKKTTDQCGKTKAVVYTSLDLFHPPVF